MVRALASVACLTLVAVGVGSAAASGSGERAPQIARSPLPQAGTITATIPLDGDLADLDFGEGALWGTTHGPDQLIRIDPRTNAVSATIQLPPGESARWLAADKDGVWVSNVDDGTVSRVDPETNRVVATIHVPGRPGGLALSPSAVWVVDAGGESVTRIDTRTNTVVAAVTLGDTSSGEHPTITVGAGSVWVAVPGAAQLMRIDPRTNAVLERIPARICAIAAGNRSIWGAACGAGQLLRVSARSRLIAAIDTGRPLQSVKVGRGSVWATTRGTRSLLVRVDPRSEKVVARLALGGYARGGRLAIGDGALWVEGRRSIVRIEPSRPRHGCEPRRTRREISAVGAHSVGSSNSMAHTAFVPTRIDCH